MVVAVFLGFERQQLMQDAEVALVASEGVSVGLYPGSDGNSDNDGDSNRK